MIFILENYQKPPFALFHTSGVATMKVLAKSCIGYTGPILKNRDFRKSRKNAPSKIEISLTFQRLFMTWSTVQHMETLTPSSIQIFQGASVGTGRGFMVGFQSDCFKDR